VPRCGAWSLVKIVVRESMCHSVMVESTSSPESLQCQSARICEDPLELKCVTSSCCLMLGVTESLNMRIKLKCIVGQGPVKGKSLKLELISIWGDVVIIVSMYCVRDG
jgi:hypothetical protein